MTDIVHASLKNFKLKCEIIWNSGVAVSVTTFTDVIAFLVSSSQYCDDDHDVDDHEDGGDHGGYDGGGGVQFHNLDHDILW